MSDFEQRIARARLGLEPSPEVEERVWRAALASAASHGEQTSLPRRRWRLRRRTAGMLALAAAVVGAGAWATARWTFSDLPRGGHGASAFVLPETDLLPGGYTRQHPPRIQEIPTRPSLLFPAGVSYTQALARYYAARQHGQVVPTGVTLSDPLPAGKVLQVRGNGRVALDPAAPAGYDPVTGIVFGFGALQGTLPRCEVMLADSDPTARTPCTKSARQAYVVERDGRWVSAGVQVILPTRAVGTTALGVLERPRSFADRLPPAMAAFLRTRPGIGWLGRVEPDLSRLALLSHGTRYYVVPATKGVVCLYAVGGSWGGGTCNPRSVLVTYGAIPIFSGPHTGPRVAAALVGDGFDRVQVPGGPATRIVDNVFALRIGAHVKTLIISGPAGHYRIAVL